MSIHMLRQERGRLIYEARQINGRAEAERRNLTQEEQEKFEKLMSDIHRLNNEIRLFEAGANEDWLRRSTGVQAAGDSPMSYINQEGREVRFLTPPQRLADVVGSVSEPFDIGKAIRGKITGDWKDADFERRVLSEGLDTSGGFLLPVPVSAEFIDLARNQSVAIQAGARTVPMETNTLNLARLDSDPRAVWRQENAEITEDDFMAFSKITFTARTLGAFCRMSIELLEDAPNVGTIVRNGITQGLALELDRVVMFGQGAGAEPLGVYNDPDANVISLGVNGGQITYDNLVTAAQKILEANGVPTAMVYAPRTWGYFEAAKDGNGLYLVPPPAIGKLTRLVSNQVPINQTWGAAGNASCAIMGGWEKCLMGMRTQLVIEATRTGGADAFKKMQVLVRGYLRADISFARANHMTIIKGIIP